MAKTSKNRPIRFDQFKKQLADVGVDELQEVELAADVKILIRLGVSLENAESEDFRDFMERVTAAEEAEDVAMAVLAYHPSMTADEQYELFTQHGGKPHELVALWGSATQERREALGKLRPRKS